MIVRIRIFGSEVFDPSLYVGVRMKVDAVEMAPNGRRCLQQLKLKNDTKIIKLPDIQNYA